MTDGLGECDLSTLETLEQYFSQEVGPNGTCRPCQVAPLASLYLNVLETANDTQAAADLSSSYEGGDLSTIAKAMDRIKAGVSPGIREELVRLDCFTQNYVDDHAEEANQEPI